MGYPRGEVKLGAEPDRDSAEGPIHESADRVLQLNSISTRLSTAVIKKGGTPHSETGPLKEKEPQTQLSRVMVTSISPLYPAPREGSKKNDIGPGRVTMKSVGSATRICSI